MADSEKDTSSSSNGSTLQSRFILAKPKLFDVGTGVGSTATSDSNIKSSLFGKSGSLLRPAQLKPLSTNIFAKVPDGSLDSPTNPEEPSTSSDECTSAAAPDVPKFVPLEVTSTSKQSSNVTSVASTATPGFVFGQNLSERILGGANKVNDGASSSVEHSTTNGSNESETQLLFTAAASTIVENKDGANGPCDSSSISDLESAAAEYERAHALPPPPPQTTHTGEEDEYNILQIACRLFAFEGGWKERGRGVVRLNDLNDGGSRLVVRASGSLRLLINTKLWCSMVCERPAARSLKITAMDAEGQPKVMLLMAAPNDISQLYKAISTRISTLKETSSEKPSSSSQDERLQTNHSVSIPSSQTNAPLNGSSDCSENEMNESMESRESLKRKESEPCDSETEAKRPCPPQIVIE